MLIYEALQGSVRVGWIGATSSVFYSLQWLMYALPWHGFASRKPVLAVFGGGGASLAEGQAL